MAFPFAFTNLGNIPCSEQVFFTKKVNIPLVKANRLKP